MFNGLLLWITWSVVAPATPIDQSPLATMVSHSVPTRYRSYHVNFTV